jgi:hypothetical protein
VPGDEDRCGSKNLGGGNLRLRLEPTINITDQVRVHGPDRRPGQHLDGSDPDLRWSTPAARRPHRPAPPSARWTPPRIHPRWHQQPGDRQSRAKRAWASWTAKFGSLASGRLPGSYGRASCSQRLVHWTATAAPPSTGCWR